MKLFFHKAGVFGCTEGKFVCVNSLHYALCTIHEKIRPDTGSLHFFTLKSMLVIGIVSEERIQKINTINILHVNKSPSTQEGSQKKPPSIQPKNQTYI